MTSNPRIYLSPPHMGGIEMSHIQEAFDTNWISTVGPQINEFENRLQQYCQRQYAAVFSSGTSAIHLALRILGVAEGDRVICQSFTFAGTAYPIAYQNAVPVFVDSELDTWNLDPNYLEDAIVNLQKQGKKKPKAIMPVHLYGMPYMVNEVKEIAERFEIPIIEDAAEALGSIYQGKPCGSFGEMSILSFNGNKIITTSGGGALLSNSEEWNNKAKFLSTQARDPAPHYQHSEIGFNYRLGNVNAAIGLGQMDVLASRIERRRAIYDIYHSELSGFEGVKFQPEVAGVESNRWLTCILTRDNEMREKIRLSLEENNIESRPLWKAMHLQPVFAEADYFGSSRSESLFQKGLCLPSGSNMSGSDIERTISIIKKACQ